MGTNRTDFEGVKFETLEDGIRLPALSQGVIMKATKDNTQNTDFTADKDYFETTEDGRRIQVLAKGVTVPYAEAVALGVVKADTPEAAGETEKASAPSANKAAKPASDKGAK